MGVVAGCGGPEDVPCIAAGFAALGSCGPCACSTYHLPCHRRRLTSNSTSHLSRKELELRVRAEWVRWMKEFKSRDGVGEYSLIKSNQESNLYTTADVLISKYVLGQLKLTESEKNSWAAKINDYQDKKTGLYKAARSALQPSALGRYDHEHPTAFALAALKLIGRKPAHPLKLIDQLQSKRPAWGRSRCVRFMHKAAKVMNDQSMTFNMNLYGDSHGRVAECARLYSELVINERPWVISPDKPSFEIIA